MTTSTFMTGNTELAAFLATKGERLESVRGNGFRAEFHFQDSPRLQSVIADYAAGVEASAKALFDSLKLMKSLAKDAVTQSNRSTQGWSHEHAKQL